MPDRDVVRHIDNLAVNIQILLIDNVVQVSDNDKIIPSIAGLFDCLVIALEKVFPFSRPTV